MQTDLHWAPDHYQPHGELVAEGGGIIYRVSSWHPTMTTTGRRLAFAGAQLLGEFPCTGKGLAAAQEACQAFADGRANDG